MMPPHTQKVMNAMSSQQTIDFVAALSGIDRLIADPDLEGAGMYLVETDGFLDIHTDI